MRSSRLTVRLLPWDLNDLERLTTFMGASASQVVSAVLEHHASGPRPRQTVVPDVYRWSPAFVRVRLSPKAWDEVLALREGLITRGVWGCTYGRVVEHILSPFLNDMTLRIPSGTSDLATALDRSVQGGFLVFFRTVHGLT